MTVHLDTSLLIDACCRPHRSLRQLEDAIKAGHRLALSAPVVYEWLRGRRSGDELHDQERLLPLTFAIPFDSECARGAAGLYATLRKPRGREMDLAIAACAIEHGAALWTLNPADFEDVPGLTLYRPGAAGA